MLQEKQCITLGRVIARFLRSLNDCGYDSFAFSRPLGSASRTFSFPSSSFMTSRTNKSTWRSESSVSGGGDETAPSNGTLRSLKSEDDPLSHSSDKDDVLDSLQHQIESLQIVDTSPEDVCQQINNDHEWRQNLPESVQKLGRWIQESEHILVLTGAGISVSAGIPDFRTPGCGLVRFAFVIL